MIILLKKRRFLRHQKAGIQINRIFNIDIGIFENSILILKLDKTSINIDIAQQYIAQILQPARLQLSGARSAEAYCNRSLVAVSSNTENPVTRGCIPSVAVLDKMQPYLRPKCAIF